MMKRIFKAIATVTIVSTITRVMAFFFKIFLSRKLGAEILGVYQITMSIFMLASAFPSSGLPTTLSRKVAEFRALDNHAGEKGVFSTTLITSLVLSFAIMLFFLLFPNVTNLFFTDVRCRNMFIIMLPALISTSIYCITRGWFWGIKDYFIYSTSEFIQEILSIIIVIIALFTGIFGSDLNNKIAIAFVVSDYIATAILVILYFVKGGKIGRPKYIKEVYRSALPLTTTRLLGSVVSSLMALLIPALLVNNGMSTGEATASYGRASGMIMPLLFAPATMIGSLAVVLIPELASKHARNLPLSDSISKSITFSLIVSGFFLGLFTAAGEEITYILYKDSIAGKFMDYAAIMMIPLSVNQIIISILNTLGKENKTFISHIAGCILLFIMILILPRFIGIHTYFVGLIVFHTFTMILNLITLSKTVKLGKSLAINSLMIVIYPLTVGYIIRCLSLNSINIYISVGISLLFITITYPLYLSVFRLIDIKIVLNRLRIKKERKLS